MKGDDFAFIAEVLKHRSGLSLTLGKSELITNRLRPVAERNGFATLSALVQELRCGNESLLRSVTEAMTIHDTSFFRDRAAFDALRNEIFPQLIRARLPRRRLRIWCAAAATGQEPYSLAMMIADAPQCAGWDIEIIATDVSAEAIARADSGVFHETEVQRGLPVPLLAKHFRKEPNGWRLADDVRSRVRFRVFNLLDSFADMGVFDLILCRNLLMYFEPATKADILDRLADRLEPDGYLVLGAAETVLGLSSSFTPLRHLRGIKMKAGRASLPRGAAMG